jgi:hypothetical protein
MRAVSPGVVEEVVGVVDLIVSQVLKGRGAVNNVGGDMVVGIGVS